MEESVERSLKTGFTIARWGIDICLGALFIAVSFIILALTKNDTELLILLMILLAMCVVGLIVFAVGRVMVGLQSRKLNLHTSRPLSDEERWFVACMLEMEEKGRGVAFYSNAARFSGSSADDIAAGAVSTIVINKFFKVGKKYMGRNIAFNRLPTILSLVAAIVIVIFAIV